MYAHPSFFSLNDSSASLLVLSFTICMGLLLSKIKIKGYSLGITNVLFVGIILSSLGIVVNMELIALVKDLGLVLFIYTVGLQVGPSFFSSFRKGGLRLNFLALCIVALGVVTTLLISFISGASLDVMAGVYSGSISSTPGMSAAQQAVACTGVGSADVIANSYAVTYPIGVVIPILCLMLIRNVCKVQLDKEPVPTPETTDIKTLSSVTSAKGTTGKCLAVLFTGICLGVALGSVAIPVGLSVPMRFGLAGGPLIVAILISHFGTRMGVIDLHVTSGSTMSFIRELGIALFLASVGLSTGGTFLNSFCCGGYMWLLYGLTIALLPLLSVGLFARRRMKIDFFTLMGLAGGATTDTPALAYANSVANNPNNTLPASSYATVYPLTVFMRIFTAQMLVMLAAH